MNTSSTRLLAEAAAAFTHIFLSLDLLEEEILNEETRTILTVIRQNAERLQKLIQPVHELLT